MPFQLRDMTEADIPALFHVRPRTRENALSLAQLEGLGITPHSVAQKLQGTFQGWVGTVQGQVVGFCMADRATGELWVIALLPEHEGQGLGGALMGRAEQWLRDAGCTRAWLTTDVDPRLRAYGFYRHRGWTDWKLEDGMRWMQLELGPGVA